MLGLDKLRISNIPEISAIYYALLQCGYEYYPIQRGIEHIDRIRSFAVSEHVPSFFSEIKQSACEVYPYWPRAAILETASFYLQPDLLDFENFGNFKKIIMGASNIADHERSYELWDWITEFPKALKTVLTSADFHHYMKWENQWIAEQNRIHNNALQHILTCLDVCVTQYQSPVQSIQIVINPIKCVYSSDYHMNGNCFVFSSGEFRSESIIHEFLHHVIHPLIQELKGRVMQTGCVFPDVDRSYYLSGEDVGKLNAFEEYAVRELTKRAMTVDLPISLIKYMERLL